MRFLCLIIYGALITPVIWAQSNANGVAVEKINITQPREFGYQLGDIFDRQLSLELRNPYVFVEDSLPQPSRLNRWIAFHSFDLESTRRQASVVYDITLRYQVTNVETNIVDAGVPSHLLKITNGDETLTFLVPPSRTTIAPFGNTQSTELAADITPQLVSVGLNKIVMLGVLLASSLLGYWWFQWGLFRRKTVAPFNHCYRRVKQLGNEAISDPNYASLLREVHHAFNQTAGQIIFPENLQEFLENHQNFAPVHAEIAEYFSHTNAYFFGATKLNAKKLPNEQLRHLLKQCAAAERKRT